MSVAGLQAEWVTTRRRLDVAQAQIRADVERDLHAEQLASRTCHVAETALRSARRSLRALVEGQGRAARSAATVRRQLELAADATAELERRARQPTLPLQAGRPELSSDRHEASA